MTQTGLAALDQRVSRDLECLYYPDKPWVEQVRAPDGSAALDCAVIGGGQFGLAVSFGLRREKVGNVTVFDRSKAGHEGPWVCWARTIGRRGLRRTVRHSQNSSNTCVMTA